MGRVLIGGSAGGVSSSDVTASKWDVVAGKRTITTDSNDDVVEGTLPEKTVDIPCFNNVNFIHGNNYFMDFPTGVYRRENLNGAGGRTYVGLDTMRPVIGYTNPALVHPGQTIAGLTGTMPVTYGLAYTPQPWAQTIAINGHYVVNNFVINPIPGNYLDITKNQSVFLNGVFGTIVNHGWMPARYASAPKAGIASGLARDTGVLAAKLDGNAILTQLTYRTAQSGILIMGSIDFSKFRTVYVAMNGVVIPNTPTYLRVGITDKNKTWTFGNAYNDVVKEGWQAVNIDISSVTTNGYLYVGCYSSSSASPKVRIEEIILKP